ncbi:MAG: rcsF [Chlamydiia bacterium]|nr:rcsF [Chlamydiia bacterium]
MEFLQCKPIGHFCSSQLERYMAPRQADLALIPAGHIALLPDCNFEQALQDLAGFERIWVIYWFHRNLSWKPKVLTPRGGPKRGVFATRSPHRPNPIGMSCVELVAIQGRDVFVGKNDLLDGTPILDIKPYLPYADAFPKSKEGWTESETPGLKYQLKWSDFAHKQAIFIESRAPFKLIQSVELVLRSNPYPFPNHRIKKVAEHEYELACKTWRIFYSIQEDTAIVIKIFSGYDEETLEGKKASKWDDVPLHREFVKEWYEQ